MDCNDGDAAIYPGAPEICTDRIDNNCNDLIDAMDPNVRGCPDACTDNDDDDYAVEGGVCGPVDCDDTDPDVNPGEREICDDGFDNNCDANADTVDNRCQAKDDDDDELEDDEDDDHEDHRHHRRGRDDDDRRGRGRRGRNHD